MPRHAAAIWVDNANITRTRVVPARRLLDNPSFCIPLTSAIQSCAANSDTPFAPPVGEVYLIPEPTRTLYSIDRWMPTAGAFFGNMRCDPHSATEWSHCPRSFLGRQIQRLTDQYGLAPTVGFEIEFQLLERDTQIPIDAALYCSMKAFHDGRAWTLLREIVASLEDDLGIPIHQYHAESACGQFEISTGVFGMEEDDDIVRAVDKLVLVRQTIYAMAAQRGLQATMLPKLTIGHAGTAAHVHVGLVDVATRANLFATNVTRAHQFVAGILQELPSLCLLLAPTVNSYDRLQPQCWAGAYQCVGYENREAPLRLVGPPSAREHPHHVEHVEVKTLDATANPYLALGTLLAAGMSGLDRQLVLPPLCDQDPASMSVEERPPMLPRSLEDAIDQFQARRETLWNGVLSESYAALLLTLRRAELAHYSAFDRNTQVKELLLRY